MPRGAPERKKRNGEDKEKEEEEGRPLGALFRGAIIYARLWI